MSAAEGNDDIPEEVNNAAPPPAGEIAAAGGGEVRVQDHNAITDLSAYFNTLIDTLHRCNENVQNAAAAGGATNNNNASQLQSVMVSLLWNGAEQIVATVGSRTGFAQGGDTDNAAILPPNFAAVYLYAVAQNIVALEEIVAQGRLCSTMMDTMDGGVTIKEVSAIISAASIAAIYCDSRDMISKTGILPALAHLIESDSSRLGEGARALTPFDAEFIQLCLLAGQYRYAKSFLQSRPVRNMTLHSPHLALHPTMYLRYHYYAGLVHIGCDDWNSALDSFYLCMTIPCQTVSAISIAARKKTLLVECILLEAEELDKKSGSDGLKSGKRALESRVLGVPGAASPVLARYMNKSSNRVGGGADDCAMFGESVFSAVAGADTSEQASRERGSSRRNAQRAASTISSEGGDDGEAAAGGGRKTKSYPQLGRYHELVSTYISGNANHYATLLTEMTELLRIDGNLGLAKRLEGRLIYRAVRQKASVYSVTGMASLEETVQNVCSSLHSTAGGDIATRRIEDLLMSMAVRDLEDPLVADPFFASIDQSTNMVSFEDEDPTNQSVFNEELENDLASRLATCVALADRVRQLDIALAKSTKYKMHAMKQKAWKSEAKFLPSGQGVADLGHGSMDISSTSEWLS